MSKYLLALVFIFLVLIAGRANGQLPTPSASEKLDAAAYYALVQREDVLLKAARDKGGDPERYARENPLAIHDAAGSERDVAALVFVLKSGANPNAARHPNSKGGPILATQLDPEKIALLVKAGADINGTDHNGYAVLSQALYLPQREYRFPPNPKAGVVQRVYSKLDIVRFLLDAGAALNEGPGSIGRGGMLALTRREDRDVIDYLIARGATLRGAQLDFLNPEADEVTRGPLITALMQGREDLALMMLQRDKLIVANDRLALLHAARRGFGDLAMALLAAGADPTASDEAGSTPLMWARKARDMRLVAALLKAGAPDSRALPKVSFERDGLNAFDKKAAVIIDDVAFMDSPRFELDMYLPKGDGPQFLLYGAEPHKFDPFSCERASTFTIVASMGAGNNIQVGICKSQAKRVLAGVERSRAGMRSVLATFGKDVTFNAALAESAGWMWKETNLPGGARSFEFPLLLIGHGVISIRTYVLINKSASRAVILQANVDRLCQYPAVRTPLCLEPSRAFAEIADRLNRLPD